MDELQIRLVDGLAMPHASTSHTAAFLYLQAASRMAAHPDPARALSLAEAGRLAEATAETIAGVITLVLEGLELDSDRQLRGRELAAQELRKISAEGSA
jgi:hypothetical protein